MLVAYEYPGYHSKSGAALARRVKQVAESFELNGWQVTVVHKDQVGETGDKLCVVKKESASITRIPVRSDRSEFSVFERSIFRRLFTLYCLLKKGDRTYRWAESARRSLPLSQLSRPDLVISFFTPRGPIVLGRYFAKKYDAPWIADLQDELDQGTLSSNKYFSALNGYLSHVWVKKILSAAKAVVHVSPEWANVDSAILGRHIACIRHAMADHRTEIYNRTDSTEFRVFYGGSIEPAGQELETLNKVLLEVRAQKPVKLIMAGGEKAHYAFRNSLDESIDIEYAGWLDAEAYSQTIKSSHCCLIVPWSGADRQAIPSKFYEVCTMRPVWIVGKDSGAFSSLVGDLKHPLGRYGDVAFNVSALEKAVAGDYSSMFTLDKCAVAPITERQLCEHYLRLVN